MMQAAEVMPLLSARYGPRERVGLYPIGLVYFIIRYVTDKGRVSDWQQRAYMKQAERRAR